MASGGGAGGVHDGAAGAGCPGVAGGAEPVGAEEQLGKPLSDWTIHRSGEGRYSFSRDVAGGSFRDYDLVTKRFALSAADFAKVEALLAGARPYTESGLPCRMEISDGIYGRIAWGENDVVREVKFNFGCLSEAVNPIYRKLYDANEHVKALAEAGEVVEVKEVREPRG